MKKLYLVILLLSTSQLLFSQQIECNMTFSQGNAQMQSDLVASICGDMLNYTVYPDYNMTPIKKLRISFDVLQKTDGSGYNGTDAEITQYFNDFIDSVNIRLANLKILSPSVPSPHVIDSRIRYVLNKVCFYKSDNLYTYPSRASNYFFAIDSIYNSVILTRQDLSTIDKYNTLHLIMIPKFSDPAGGMARGLSDNKWVVLKGYEYSFNWAASKAVSIHEQADHLIHAVGHALGLQHNFFEPPPKYPQCDDCGDNGCPAVATSNNYMDYNWRNEYSFSECQLAKMHYCLMGNYGTIKEDYIQDYCNFDDTQSITINTGQDITWNSSRNLLGNLSISGKLSINCNISIPNAGKVFVNNGGKLILSQGNFDNTCNNTWAGIEVQNGGYLELNSTSISDYSIDVKSGGTLRIIGGLTISGNNHIDIESGGYICVDNSITLNLTDALSVINLHNGYNLGVNTAFVTNPGTCNSILSTLNKIGSGYIYEFNDVFIQNESLTANQYIPGNNISAGTNVTNSKPQGPVVIKSGANVVFDADVNTLLDKGFDVELGASFETK